MNEKQVRQIVLDELQKNYMSGSPDVPPHSHNGNDGLNVNPVDLVGWSAIPASNKTYTNPSTGLVEYGFGSIQSLIGASTTHAGQLILDPSVSQYPIPLIIGNGRATGEPQGDFNGGFAPDGTQVAFWNGLAMELWIRFDGAWYDVSGNSTVTPPGGSDTQIQFNNSGSFGGSAFLTFDSSNAIIKPTATTVGTTFTINAGAGLSGNNPGGNLQLGGGNAQGSGQGGHVQLLGGSTSTGNVGGVYLGRGNLGLTSANDGFVYITSVAGTPTGTPVTQVSSSIAMVYDRTNNKLYAYNGSWKSVTLS